MKIAILGTRGIPNNYGGFEQCAEYLSVGLAKKGHDISIYSPNFHPYKDVTFKGVKIIKKSSPKHLFGNSASNFIYDYLCLKDAVKQDFDIILELGLITSSLSIIFCRQSPYFSAAKFCLNVSKRFIIDICSEDWSHGVDQASSQLQLVEEIVLDHVPVSATHIEVFVDGFIWPDWTYDSVTNTVTFTIIPPEESLIEVVYNYQ